MTVNYKQQSGITLIIGLVMLLLLTIIMLAAMRVTSLEERMAGNLRNQNIAFQAAESALREAEAFIDGSVGRFAAASSFKPLKVTPPVSFNEPADPPYPPNCVTGLCGATIPDGTTTAAGQAMKLIRLATTDKITANGTSEASHKPEYIIQFIGYEDRYGFPGTGYAMFRITTRAWGGDINSVVQLQSTYISFVQQIIR
jgi:type IV pilus assembly protein PilX